MTPLNGVIFYYFTASLRTLPALKTGAFFAAILIVSPVLGFLPSLSFLWATLNLPKPVKTTSSPLDKDLVISSKSTLRYSEACPFEIPIFLTKVSIKLSFVINLFRVPGSEILTHFMILDFLSENLVKILLLGVFDHPAFPDDVYLDFARII